MIFRGASWNLNKCTDKFHISPRNSIKRGGIFRLWLVRPCERNIKGNSHQFDAGKDHTLLLAFQRDVSDRRKVEMRVRRDSYLKILTAFGLSYVSDCVRRRCWLIALLRIFLRRRPHHVGEISFLQACVMWTFDTTHGSCSWRRVLTIAAWIVQVTLRYQSPSFLCHFSGCSLYPDFAHLSGNSVVHRRAGRILLPLKKLLMPAEFWKSLIFSEQILSSLKISLNSRR